MPLRPARARILRARASPMTAEAVALMTAVTPPDWAYRSVPEDMRGPWMRRKRCGSSGIDAVSWRQKAPSGGSLSPPACRPGSPILEISFEEQGDATGTVGGARIGQGNAGGAAEGAPGRSAYLHRRPAAGGSRRGQPAGPAGEGGDGARRPGL